MSVEWDVANQFNLSLNINIDEVGKEQAETREDALRYQYSESLPSINSRDHGKFGGASSSASPAGASI